VSHAHAPSRWVIAGRSTPRDDSTAQTRSAPLSACSRDPVRTEAPRAGRPACASTVILRCRRDGSSSRLSRFLHSPRTSPVPWEPIGRLWGTFIQPCRIDPALSEFCYSEFCSEKTIRPKWPAFPSRWRGRCATDVELDQSHGLRGNQTLAHRSTRFDLRLLRSPRFSLHRHPRSRHASPRPERL